ncbi:hypothetical protein ElyMa_002438500 [Elysia marginata]|uniref:Uncharacterized protein n=1 Tax=Elysia marginata TaxID=1093978 RepID=A0AAV4GJ38_9GAST|nr:hypothetical protein ElyMa_002438500 [Elysia marginata]
MYERKDEEIAVKKAQALNKVTEDVKYSIEYSTDDGLYWRMETARSQITIPLSNFTNMDSPVYKCEASGRWKMHLKPWIVVLDLLCKFHQRELNSEQEGELRLTLFDNSAYKSVCE